MKKNKILVAKISIFILLFAIIGIGFLKFIDYLDEPSDNFSDALNSISLSTKSVEKVLGNDIFTLFDGSTQTNIDTKISYSDASQPYDNYLSLLVSSSLITSIKYDKDNKYLISNTKVTKNGSTYSIEYIEDNSNIYIKDNNKSYEKLANSIIDLDILNMDVYLGFINNITSSLKGYVINHDISSLNGNTTINNNSYNVEIMSISLTGSEMSNLISEYTSTILNDVNLNNNKEYVINIYRNISSKNIIKFTVNEYNKSTIFSYEFIDNFYSIRLSNVTYSLNGTKNDLVIIKSVGNKRVNFTYKKDNNSFSGTLSVTTNDTPIYNLDYLGEREDITQNTISLSLIINLYPSNISEDMKVTFNSSILVTKNVSNDKKNITDMISTNNKTLKEFVDKCLKNIYDELNIQDNYEVNPS